MTMKSDNINAVSVRPHKDFAVGDLVCHFMHKNQVYIVKSVGQDNTVSVYSLSEKRAYDWTVDTRVLDLLE